eukprot:504060-Rhodomonas_salina.1
MHARAGGGGGRAVALCAERARAPGAHRRQASPHRSRGLRAGGGAVLGVGRPAPPRRSAPRAPRPRPAQSARAVHAPEARGGRGGGGAGGEGQARGARGCTVRRSGGRRGRSEGPVC